MALTALAKLNLTMAAAKAPPPQPAAPSGPKPPVYEPWQQLVAASLAGGMIAATGRGHSPLEVDALFRRMLVQVFGGDKG